MVASSSVPLAATITGGPNTDVVWSIQEGSAGGTLSGGADDGPVVYTAPADPGPWHVTATSVADPARSATLTVTVQPGGIAVNPPAPAVLTGGAVTFQAFAPGNQPVAWSLPAGPAAGAIDGAGVYTAPAAPGSYLVTAATAGGLTGSVTVKVLTTNFTGDGKPFLNAADLAILADAWGGAPGTANFNPATDLNQDGVVDDLDLALFFSQFGGRP